MSANFPIQCLMLPGPNGASGIAFMLDCLSLSLYSLLLFFDGFAAVERIKINSKSIALSSRILDSLFVG